MRAFPAAWLVLGALLCSTRGTALGANELASRPGVHPHEEHLPPRQEIPPGPGEESEAPAGVSAPWWVWDRATGDWNGARPWLERRGIQLELIYTGEVFSKLRGGITSRRATRYRGNLDIVLTGDSGKLGWWPGGMVFLYLQHAHGSGLTDRDVGDAQRLSNIDARPFTQLSEYWLEQRLLSDRVRLKLGKQDANVDFASLVYGDGFVHSSFGVIPTMPLPTFPDPALGAAAFVEPAPWITVGAGAYDGAAGGGTSGFDTAFDGEGGTLGVVEVALRTAAADVAWKTGIYRAGAWYHSEDVEEIGRTSPRRTVSGRHGFHLAFDQLLWKEREEPGDAQGLGAFFQLGWAPEDRSRIGLYLGGGLLWTGPLPRRDQDLAGVAVAHARFSGRLTGADARPHETVLEVFYQARLTPWLAVQPDVQVITNPGGTARDAVAAGVRFVVDL